MPLACWLGRIQGSPQKPTKLAILDLRRFSRPVIRLVLNNLSSLEMGHLKPVVRLPFKELRHAIESAFSGY